MIDAEMRLEVEAISRFNAEMFELGCVVVDALMEVGITAEGERMITSQLDTVELEGIIEEYFYQNPAFLAIRDELKRRGIDHETLF